MRGPAPGPARAPGAGGGGSGRGRQGAALRARAPDQGRPRRRGRERRGRGSLRGHAALPHRRPRVHDGVRAEGRGGGRAAGGVREDRRGAHPPGRLARGLGRRSRDRRRPAGGAPPRRVARGQRGVRRDRARRERTRGDREVLPLPTGARAARGARPAPRRRGRGTATSRTAAAAGGAGPSDAGRRLAQAGRTRTDRPRVPGTGRAAGSADAAPPREIARGAPARLGQVGGRQGREGHPAAQAPEHGGLHGRRPAAPGRPPVARLRPPRGREAPTPRGRGAGCLLVQRAVRRPPRPPGRRAREGDAGGPAAAVARRRGHGPGQAQAGGAVPEGGSAQAGAARPRRAGPRPDDRRPGRLEDAGGAAGPGDRGPEAHAGSRPGRCRERRRARAPRARCTCAHRSAPGGGARIARVAGHHAAVRHGRPGRVPAEAAGPPHPGGGRRVAVRRAGPHALRGRAPQAARRPAPGSPVQRRAPATPVGPGARGEEARARHRVRAPTRRLPSGARGPRGGRGGRGAPARDGPRWRRGGEACRPRRASGSEQRGRGEGTAGRRVGGPGAAARHPPPAGEGHLGHQVRPARVARDRPARVRGGVRRRPRRPSLHGGGRSDPGAPRRAAEIPAGRRAEGALRDGAGRCRRRARGAGRGGLRRPDPPVAVPAHVRRGGLRRRDAGHHGAGRAQPGAPRGAGPVPEPAAEPGHAQPAHPDRPGPGRRRPPRRLRRHERVPAQGPAVAGVRRGRARGDLPRRVLAPSARRARNGRCRVRRREVPASPGRPVDRAAGRGEPGAPRGRGQRPGRERRGEAPARGGARGPGGE